VPGCGELLHQSGGKAYNTRYRLCELHLRSPRVVLEDGSAARFCQARAPRRVLGRPARALALSLAAEQPHGG
jgi:hypothetical protein